MPIALCAPNAYLVDDGLVGQGAGVEVGCLVCWQLGILLCLHGFAQHKQLTFQLITRHAGLTVDQHLCAERHNTAIMQMRAQQCSCAQACMIAIVEVQSTHAIQYETHR